MEEKKKCGWGGARPGAGRKKTGLLRDVTLSVRFRRDFVEKIRAAAQNNEQTLAEWLEQHICF